MNLKDFKKVHEDEHKAVMRNSKGHEFSIAKKALSKSHLAALKELPLHAEDGALIQEPDPNSLDYQQQLVAEQEPPVDTSATPPKLSPVQQAYNDQVRATTNRPDAMFGPDGEPPQEVDNSAYELAMVQSKHQEEDKNSDAVAKQKREAFNAKRNAALGIAPPATAEIPEEIPESPADQPEQPIDHAPPRPRTQAQPAPISAPQMKQELDAEAIKWQQDLANGHITPETYSGLFAKKDTLGKIGTLFGLLISGAGSGLAGQPNAVMEMMNKEINNDLDAQKQSKTNAQNFLKIHQQSLMNHANIGRINEEQKLIRAQTMEAELKNMMMLTATHSLTQMVNKLPEGSPTKANAVGALSKVQQGVAQQASQNNTEAAFKAQNEALRTAGLFVPGMSQLADAKESHHLAGYGDANRPIPEGIRDEMVGKAEYDRAAKNYIAFAKKYGGINPRQLDPRIISQGRALAANVQNQSRAKNNGGVWKPGEQSFIETTVPSDPAKWNSAFNSIPKVEQTIRDNEAEARTKAEKLGITDFRGFGGDKKERDEEVREYKGKNYTRAEYEAAFGKKRK